jgi:hypothetical protein
VGIFLCGKGLVVGRCELRVVGDSARTASATQCFGLTLHAGKFVTTAFKAFHFAGIFAVQHLQRTDFDFDQIEQVFNQLFG